MIKYLVWRDLKSRYAGTFIGFFWTFIYPLVNFCLFIFVFPILLKVTFPGSTSLIFYALNLLCGMLPWIAFQDSIFRATPSLVENPNLVKAAPFPTLALPLSPTLACLINQLIAMLLLLIFVLIYSSISHHLLILPILLAIQLLFTVGLSWALAAVNVFFRDTFNLIGLILIIWMYITPIFYPTTLYPDSFKFLLRVNFWAYLVEAYRDIILRNSTPPLIDFVIMALFAFFVFIGGLFLFVRFSDRYADMV